MITSESSPPLAFEFLLVKIKFNAEVVKLAKHTALKMLHIRNAAGSNPALGTHAPIETLFGFVAKLAYAVDSIEK